MTTETHGDAVSPYSGQPIYSHYVEPAGLRLATDWAWSTVHGGWVAVTRDADEDDTDGWDWESGDGPAVRLLPVADRPSSGRLLYRDATGAEVIEGDTMPEVVTPDASDVVRMVPITAAHEATIREALATMYHNSDYGDDRPRADAASNFLDAHWGA